MWLLKTQISVGHVSALLSAQRGLLRHHQVLVIKTPCCQWLSLHSPNFTSQYPLVYVLHSSHLPLYLCLCSMVSDFWNALSPLGQLLNPTHSLPLCSQGPSLGPRQWERQEGQSQRPAVFLLLLLFWSFPTTSWFHHTEMLFCSTYPARGMLHQLDCPRPPSSGWKELVVLSRVDYLCLISQKGKKLTLLMFTRLLFPRKDSNHCRVNTPSSRISERWMVGLSKERLPSWVSGKNPVFHKPCLLPYHRKNHKMTERQRRAAGSRMT